MLSIQGGHTFFKGDFKIGTFQEDMVMTTRRNEFDNSLKFHERNDRVISSSHYCCSSSSNNYRTGLATETFLPIFHCKPGFPTPSIKANITCVFLEWIELNKSPNLFRRFRRKLWEWTEIVQNLEWVSKLSGKKVDKVWGPRDSKRGTRVTGSNAGFGRKVRR